MAEIPLQIVQADRDLTAGEARELTEAIRDNLTELELKIVQAWQGRIWLALGYESWDAWVAGEFRKPPLALPREERQAAVQSLRAWGLSQRAIASVTGVSKKTIQNDQQVDRNYPPGPVTGLDGKTYPVRQPKPAPSLTISPATVVCPTCGGSGKVTP